MGCAIILFEIIIQMTILDTTVIDTKSLKTFMWPDINCFLMQKLTKLNQLIYLPLRHKVELSFIMKRFYTLAFSSPEPKSKTSNSSKRKLSNILKLKVCYNFLTSGVMKQSLNLSDQYT